MEVERRPPTASHAERRTERRSGVRTSGAIRDLKHAAAFEDSQWPRGDADHDGWLFRSTGAADAGRADALVGRGMSVVGWRDGDCDGCVRDLAARRADRQPPR